MSSIFSSKKKNPILFKPPFSIKVELYEKYDVGIIAVREIKNNAAKG